MVPSVHLELSYVQLTLAVIAIGLIAGVLARLYLYWRWQELIIAEDQVMESDRRNRELFAWVVEAAGYPDGAAPVLEELVRSQWIDGTQSAEALSVATTFGAWARNHRRLSAGRHRANRLVAAP